MKALRIIFSILILLIAIAILAIACLLVFFDPNQLKPVITEEVNKQTGYQLVIDGNLSWSFYPRLGVKIERMTLSKPQAGEPFVELRDIRIAAEPAQLLHGIEKLQGMVYISDARLMNVHATQAEVGLHWQDKILTLQPVSAALYQGSLQGKAHGRDLSSAMPHWDWDVQLTRVQLKPLLLDVNGPDSKLNISAASDVKLKAETQGVNREQMLSHLNGSCEFSLDNGIVEGTDLNYLLQTADAFINKQPADSLVNSNQTAFNRLTGSLLIKNGIATTNNLQLLAPAFVANAQGTINVANSDLNLQLQVKPQDTLKTQWEIPMRLTGNLRQPDMRLDTIEIQKFILRQNLEKVKSKAREEIQKHIPGKAGQLLQNLLGK